jgi:hypothetical protein
VTTSDGQALREDGGGALPGEIVLRDGTPALIWPLLPSDRAVLREGFAALSDRSRYRRFLSSTPELTEPMSRRLVDDVDGITTWRLSVSPFRQATRSALLAWDD